MKNIKYILLVLVILGFFLFLANREQAIPLIKEKLGMQSAAVIVPFVDDFALSKTIKETGSMSESNSTDWWLNSGGYFYLTGNGYSQTIQGDLPLNDPWKNIYLQSNPVDTDAGLHPQNIFRLLTRSKWNNYTQEVYFKITKQNMSASPERDAWSGLLLFNRYKDSDNLYYTGIRADGTAVIKYKKGGNYVTLTQPVVFPGRYNKVTNPNLIPQNVWVGLRSEVKTNPDNTVSIKLYMDNGKTGNWTLIASAVDSAANPILGSQYAGIRTDFMDVQFSNFKITETDLLPPTAPGNLSLLSKTSTSARLSWNASSDDIGVVGYNIYRDDKFYDSTRTSTTMTVPNLVPGKTYTFTVKAKDQVGNLSAASNILTITP
jgi:hypothetical protein